MSTPNPNPNKEGIKNLLEGQKIETANLQDPSDVRALKNILTSLTAIRSTGDSTITMINELKKISRQVNRMVPWKIGCVKDTFYSPVWKGLELLERTLNSPQYQEIINKGLPTIIKEILELQNVIEEINKSITSGKKPNEVKNLSTQKAYQIFGNFILLTNIYRSELNVEVIIEHLTYLNATKLENSLCVKCAILRNIQVIGECTYQLTDPPKLLGDAEQIKKVRDLITHKSDKGQENVAQSLQNIFNAHTDSPEWELLQRIVIADFPLLTNVAYQLTTKINQLKMQLKQSHDWEKSAGEIFEQNNSCNIDLLNIDSLYRTLKGECKNIVGKSSISSALGMLDSILAEIRLMENIAKEKGAVKDYALEYCLVNIGAACKHIVNNKEFESATNILQIKGLLQGLRQLDDHRDKLMHHSYERDEDALRDNSHYVMETLATQLRDVSALLARNWVESELNKLCEEYKKLENKFNNTNKKIQHKISKLLTINCSQEDFEAISKKINEEEAMIKEELRTLHVSVLQRCDVFIKQACEYFTAHHNKYITSIDVERAKKLETSYKNVADVFEYFYRGQDKKIKELAEKINEVTVNNKKNPLSQ